MKHSVIGILGFIVLLAASCGKPGEPTFSHEECNGVYYWKTTFAEDSATELFLQKHHVGHIYLRMFDVSYDSQAVLEDEKLVPNASVRVDNYEPITMPVTPTVYITLDAMRRMNGREGFWADKIVTRALNMCSYNRIDSVDGLQLDCDWTPSTEASFFTLCDSVRHLLSQKKPGAMLSSTIRLHQLARKAPPVDYGVLMVYNTGSFKNPDEKNSIIDRTTVEPYLKYLDSYSLHLDVAYPTYSWYLLFHRREFKGLIQQIDLSDTTVFGQNKAGSYVVKKRHMSGLLLLNEGDIVRHEQSAFEEVYAVKQMIEKQLKDRPHSNILYHLDIENLSKYSDNEIDSLYTVGR